VKKEVEICATNLAKKKQKTSASAPMQRNGKKL
jgi:hypothetical protein